MFRGGNDGFTSVRFSPAGRRLLTAGNDGGVRLWDARGGVALAELMGHSGRVTQANFVPGSDTVVSGGDDGTLRIWRANRSRAVPALLGQVTLARGGTVAVGGSVDGRVTWTDLEAGVSRELERFDNATAAAASEDGSTVVAIVLDGPVRAWNPDTGRTWDVPTPKTAKYSLALDRTARRLAFGEDDGSITVQGVDGTNVRTLDGHRAVVYDVRFSADGTRLVSASVDGTARVWDLATGRAEHVLRGHRGAVNAAAFTARGDAVATAGDDATIRVWTLATGKSRILHGHVGVVNSVAFAPNGESLISAGQDGTLRVWDRRRADPSLVLFKHADGASDATFTPDGEAVVSAGGDGWVRWTTCEVCGPLETAMRLARTRADREISALDRQRFAAESG
jgi:WD40 repeat protein